MIAVHDDSTAIAPIIVVSRMRSVLKPSTPRKYSAPIEQMRPAVLAGYGRMCGWTLARAHARSGDRTAIASYLGASDVFDRAVTEFAAAYADQNERDHKALVAAVKSGRITAEPDL